MEKKISSLEELGAEARRFVESLTPQEDTATLVVLSGELGAGKTAFTKEVAKALGIEETITSPTFVIEKIYTLPEGGAYRRLVHIDAYRLNSGADLRTLGFSELMKDPATLVMLEWPEQVRSDLPPPTISISLIPHTDGSRTLTYA